MLVIPAIELKDGLCVYTRHGELEDEVRFEDPLALVERLAASGISALHVVDVNASLSGSPENAHVIELITRRFPALAVQVAGGIRTEELILIYLDSGAHYVVLSPKLAREPERVGELTSDYPEQLLVAVDARDGRCNGGSAAELAEALGSEGVAGVVYTDIPIDGRVNGAQVEATVRLAQQVAVPIIGNGLLRSADEARALKARAPDGLRGVILGRSVFEAVDLAELVQAAGVEPVLGSPGKNTRGAVRPNVRL